MGARDGAGCAVGAGLASRRGAGQPQRPPSRLAYAPNRNAPLQETWELGSRGERQSSGFFHFDAMLARLPMGLALRDQGNGVFAWELPGTTDLPQGPPTLAK